MIIEFLKRLVARKCKCQNIKNVYGITLANLDNVLDSQGDYFTTDTKFDFEDDITVNIEFNQEDYSKGFAQTLGTAHVYREGSRLLTDIHFFKPQNVSTIGKFTACMGGKILRRKGKELLYCSIKEIGLCLHPADKRLNPLSYWSLK